MKQLIGSLRGRRTSLKTAGIVMVLLALAGLGAWYVMSHDNDQDSRPVSHSPARAAQLSKNTDRNPGTVRLSQDGQRIAAIELARLEEAPHQEKVRAFGTVLDVARINELANSYANAKTQLLTAQAKIDVSRRTYERARRLLTLDSISAAQTDIAEGAFRVDEAAVAAAESQLKTLAATARQEWGRVIGDAIIERTPVAVRLIERDQVLVQVTLPPDVSLDTQPVSALAQVNRGRTNVELQFVSSSPRSDPRIQGFSYFFTASGDSGLLPGTSVIVYVPTGKIYQGVFIEDTAIVHWQGRSWVYLRSGPDTFTRNPIATDQPVSDDDYVVGDLPKGAEIVTRGAQLLLSEELKGEIVRGKADND